MEARRAKAVFGPSMASGPCTGRWRPRQMRGLAATFEPTADAGLGRYIVQGLISSDFPAVMGTTLFLSATYLGVNLVIDLLYYRIDPRLSVS